MLITPLELTTPPNFCCQAGIPYAQWLLFLRNMLSQPFGIPATIIALLALPLVVGLIPPNRIYGVRTAETLGDKGLWYRVNRYGGGTFLVSSLIYLSIAWLIPGSASGETDFGRWLLHLLAFAGPLAISLLLINRYMKQTQ